MRRSGSMRAARATTTRERRSSRRPLAIAAALLLAGVAVFWLGLALGRALAQVPETGRTQTLVRTLEPATLPAVTVTVTTGAG